MNVEFEVPIEQGGAQESAPAETANPNLPPDAPERATNEPPEDAQFKRLKELDDVLDFGLDQVAEAQDTYQEALREFATLCHELWQKEKAQGSRKEKGFRRALKKHGIKVGRAYRAMKKFFPADFPAKPKPTSATSSAANEVVGRQPVVQFTGKPFPDGSEILECAFPFTADEKTEFLENLNVVGADEAKRLLVEAVRLAAERMRGQTHAAYAAPEPEAAQAASDSNGRTELPLTEPNSLSVSFLPDDPEPFWEKARARQVQPTAPMEAA